MGSSLTHGTINIDTVQEEGLHSQAKGCCARRFGRLAEAIGVSAADAVQNSTPTSNNAATAKRPQQ